MLKKWEPEYRVNDEERTMMVQAIFRELAGGGPGDHTVLVGGDMLLYGAIDSDGTLHVYETEIRASTEEHADQQAEGAAILARQKTGGFVS